jgi:hypothetical protein
VNDELEGRQWRRIAALGLEISYWTQQNAFHDLPNEESSNSSF